jgi:hypothetical protein
MLTLRLDKWTRVVTGLGLLLLLVAQEKVCPWLATSARFVTTPEPEKKGPPTKHDQEKRHHTRQILPHVVWDATPARWPLAWTPAGLRHSTGAREGVVSCGQERPTLGADTARLADGDLHDWLRLLQADIPLRPLSPVALTRIPDPAVRTSIHPTGPPRC